MARLLSLTYGAISTDETTYRLDGPIRMRKGVADFTISATIVVAGTAITTSAEFVAACTALENAYSLDRQDLAIALDGETRFRVREGTEGYALRPSWDVPGTIPGDTMRSAVYEVSVSGRIPEPLTARAGLANLDWTADLDAACKGKLRIAGLFTRDPADPSTGSRAAYAAAIAGRVSAILTILGGTWVKIKDETSTDLDDDETSFVRGYEQRVTALTALSNADLSEVRLTTERKVSAPGDVGADVRRLRRFTGRFSCAVCHTGSTSLTTAAALGQAALLTALGALAGGAVAVESIETNPDDEGSRVSVTIEALATGGASVTRRKITTSDALASNTAFMDTWTDVGDAQAYRGPTSFPLPAPATIERTVTVEEETLASVKIPGPPTPDQSGGGGSGGLTFGFGQVNAGGFGFGSQDGAQGVNGLAFGFGQINPRGFEFDPQGVGSGGGGSGGGIGDPSGAGGAGKGASWVFVRAAPNWEGPELVGIAGVGTQLQLTRTVRSTTWRLVTPEPSGGAPAGGSKNTGGTYVPPGRS